MTHRAPRLLPTDEVLLCSYFTGNGESGLKLAASEDGFTFRALNAGRGIWTSHVGDGKLVRDPCIHLGPDGTFHCVWTTGWNEPHFGYCRSRDLKTWTPQRLVRPFSGRSGVRNCWAPEIVVDPELGHFVLYWSSTLDDTPGAVEGDDGNHRIFCTLTTDFETYEPTKLLFDPGHNVIDASIVRDASRGRWMMFVKDERKTPTPRKNIFLASSANLDGPYETFREPFSGQSWAEGPSAIRIGERWFCYFDRYVDRTYAVMTSPDLNNWQDESGRLSMPIGARHLTVIRAPRSIIETLD